MDLVRWRFSRFAAIFLFISIIAYYHIIQPYNLCGQLDSFNVVMLDVGRKCSNVDFKAFILPCWRKKAKCNAISTRSKLTVGMHILNLTLAASLVLLSNDVQLKYVSYFYLLFLLTKFAQGSLVVFCCMFCIFRFLVSNKYAELIYVLFVYFVSLFLSPKSCTSG